MPKFIQIIGPQAVGKMTVGQELAKITGYKLLYNHMTIEMVRLIFDYDKEAFRKMNSIIRYEIFKEFSKSNEKGIIFTGCFDFGLDVRLYSEDNQELELKENIEEGIEYDPNQDKKILAEDEVIADGDLDGYGEEEDNEDSLNEDSDELFEGLDDEGDELLFNDDLNNDDI